MQFPNNCATLVNGHDNDTAAETACDELVNVLVRNFVCMTSDAAGQRCDGDMQRPNERRIGETRGANDDGS